MSHAPARSVIAIGLALAATFSAARADGDAACCRQCQCGGACQCACGGYCTQDFVPECYPEPFGFALRGGWLEEWPHSHFSRLGTPMVHFFFTEPAGPERDLIVDYLYTKGADGKEHEVATELEWALTRRIGIILEVPGLVLNPSDGVQEIGFGDLIVAPRFLLADFDRFMLSANVEVSTPTGDEERGLGAGETLLAPSLFRLARFGELVDGGISGRFGGRTVERRQRNLLQRRARPDGVRPGGLLPAVLPEWRARKRTW